MTAAFYNAFFTALPIAAFAIWDRPVKDFSILTQNPRTYKRKHSADLTARSFWKTGVLQGVLHGAVSSDTLKFQFHSLVYFVSPTSLLWLQVNQLQQGLQAESTIAAQASQLFHCISKIPVKLIIGYFCAASAYMACKSPLTPAVAADASQCIQPVVCQCHVRPTASYAGMLHLILRAHKARKPFCGAF